MKTLLSTFAILAMITASATGQQDDTTGKSRYGIEMNQFITGSGFSSGTEINITVISAQHKLLSFGFFYCPEQKKISGITLHHERVLTRHHDKAVTPYAFYNMVYRFTKTEVSETGTEDASNYGLYKSFEHHIGMGLQVRITKDFHVKGALGYGVYLGSIKKPYSDAVTGEITGSNGFGAIAKFGIAYTF